MVIKNIDFEKYNKMAEKSFYRKLGKVVNVVGLTIESAGPDSKLGDLCRILPDAEGARPIMAEVVGFRDKKTLLMPYDSVDGIGLGCVVENTGDPLKVTVNDKLLALDSFYEAFNLNSLKPGSVVVVTTQSGMTIQIHKPKEEGRG